MIWGTDALRLIVLSEIADAERNAVWKLFSGNAKAVKYGAEHYQAHTSNMSTVINPLFENYQREGMMSYTMDDFQKDYVREHLNLLSPDDRLKGIFPDEVLKRYTPEDRLKGLSPEDRLKYLRDCSQVRVVPAFSVSEQFKQT